MSEYQPSIIVDDVAIALGSFIQPFIGTTQIIRAHQNRVPPPHDPFVLMNDVGTYDIEVPSSFIDTGGVNQDIIGPKRIDYQLDFYGTDSGDQCNAVKTAFRTTYASSQFPDNIQPLYCSDSIMAPLVMGEQQYDERWTITVSLQYNPIVTVPVQTADALSMNIVESIS
jgi:hypothetical protein